MQEVNKTYLNKEEILNDLLNNFLNDKDKLYIKETPKDRLVFFHNNLGRDIRNHYKLWEENNPNTDINRFGHVDSSPNHPDDFSFDIIQELWLALQVDNQ